MNIGKLSGATLALALALSLATPATAQNLLTNPDFDSDVSGWTIGSQEFIVFDWSAADVEGSLASGSLEIDTATTGWVYQCVAVVGGETYQLAGAIAPLSTSAGTIDFSLEVAWNDGTNCSGSPTGTAASLLSPTEEDVWHPLSGIFVAPPSAVSAQMRLRSSWMLGIDQARYDALFLPEASRPHAFAAAALTLAALAGVQRRARRA